ncbi:4'-phosphopantetheinyl transferase family protein [Streptomyces althioticus]|uniref:4'-phosphopantetheinyl transferase family protein n=1 Tax=Streptomyces althioticus TaxID=83380 RepID=UPI0033D2B62A
MSDALPAEPETGSGSAAPRATVARPVGRPAGRRPGSRPALTSPTGGSAGAQPSATAPGPLPVVGLWAPAPGVTVVLDRVDRVLATPAALDRLRPEEHRAAAAMAHWRAREHLAGRALLRMLLAAPAGETVARGPVVPEPAGRPRLPGSPRLGVSVSHSGPYVAAAVGVGLDIGVDVQVPVPPSPGMLRRCCPARTAARLAGLPSDRSADAFARVWTVQEACVKARGTGLSGAPWRVRANPDEAAGSWGGLCWRRLPWPPSAGAGAGALACAYGPARAGSGAACGPDGCRPPTAPFPPAGTRPRRGHPLLVEDIDAH